MRYHFISLGLLVGLLAGCGDDPTGPTINHRPQVDDGRATAIPVVDTGLCLKREQLSARIDQGGFEPLPRACPQVR